MSPNFARALILRLYTVIDLSELINKRKDTARQYRIKVLRCKFAYHRFVIDDTHLVFYIIE